MAEAVVSREEIYEALKTVYDPEIPVNVVDLGLIYDVQVNETDVYVQMTLTFRDAAWAPTLASKRSGPSRSWTALMRCRSSWSLILPGRPT